jgi:predicted transcriptional regulator
VKPEESAVARLLRKKVLAAEMVAAFVSNNPLPKGELPALISAVHTAVAKLAAGPESAPPQIEAKAPAVSIRKSITQDFLICLDDGKRFKSLRRHLAGLGLTPGAVSREMEPAVRLSNGCAQLRGAAIRVSEADRTWPDSAQSRRSQERRPVEGGQDLIALP